MTVRELQDRLSDPTLVVVDCRFLLEAPEACELQYLKAHVPGAVYAHLDRDLSAERNGRNGRHPLPAPESLIERLRRLGLSDRHHVVAYDAAGGGLAASRLWWSLRYLGHDAVSILDGGWQAWVEAGGLTRGGREVLPVGDLTGAPRAEMVVDIDFVAWAARSPEWVVVDVRAGSRYRGEEEPIDRVAGHIPGAKNLYWQDTLTPDLQVRPIEELRRQFETLLGGRAADHCIVYCGSGVTSAFLVFLFEEAGLPGARLFPGSWSEWTEDPSRPVAVGVE